MRGAWWLMVFWGVLGCREEASTAEEVTPVRAETPAPVNGEIAIAWLPETVKQHQRAIEEAAGAHGVDAELVAIVTLVESGGWVGAKSPSGARGLMQVMPRTGAIIAEQRRIADFEVGRLDEPATNLDFGAYYLREQLGRFAASDLDETIDRAAAAYNGGPTALARHLAGRPSLSDQTVRYRRWVGGMWRERRHESSPTFEAWARAGGERLLARAAAEALGP
jgi:soluble lytic murein transglycosylase-like protein